MNIGLIGYRGSGKTTVGRLIARRLGRSGIDIDEQITSAAGQSIKQIFELHGEARFRDLETLAVREAVTRPNVVISFGGGALDREENRRAVAEAEMWMIYLRCEPAELLRRIAADPLTAATRPNLTRLGGGIAEIEAVLARREPVWRVMIGFEVDVTHLSPDQIAERCIASLESPA